MTGATATLLSHTSAAGFSAGDILHVFVGGSELHGAKVFGADDLDIYGVFVEPPQRALGLDPIEHFVWSTAGDDVRNGPDDVDITLYSLRKWARLAVKGNPTALHFLFTAPSLPGDWRRILDERHLFLARSSALQFTGFADDQLKRMQGILGRGKKGQRPELERKFGYDVKAGMHVIRLLHECIELLEKGTITLPRPERDLLIRVRTGQFSMEKVIDLAQRLFHECAEAEANSPLPPTIDRDAVSSLVAATYRRHWTGKV